LITVILAVDGKFSTNLLSQRRIQTAWIGGLSANSDFREKYGMEFRAEATNTFPMVEPQRAERTVFSSTFGQRLGGGKHAATSAWPASYILTSRNSGVSGGEASLWR